MSKTKKNTDKRPLFPPDFLIAVAEKGLGFVESKISVNGPRDIPVWALPVKDSRRAHSGPFGRAYGVDNFEALFLSPEGRDVMECEAEKLGVDMGGSFFSALDEQGREQEPQNPLWHYEFGGFMVTHKNKHIACLLAFAQLVGVAIPKEYGNR